MTSDIIDRIRASIKRTESAFEEIKPNLEEKILKETAIITYHRPRINDPEVEKLKGLIFPKGDVEKLQNKIAMFDIYTPKEPQVYVGIDEIVEDPKRVLRYGLQHLDEAPQKIMQEKDGEFYLTDKPILSGGHPLDPSVDFYIFEVELALSKCEMNKTFKALSEMK